VSYARRIVRMLDGQVVEDIDPLAE